MVFVHSKRMKRGFPSIIHKGVWGPCPHWGQGAKPLVKSRGEADEFSAHEILDGRLLPITREFV
jgi:hypothetical protein